MSVSYTHLDVYKRQVIVRIVCHRRLVRRLERFAQVLAEVHGKVGEVFQHNDVISVSYTHLDVYKRQL